MWIQRVVASGCLTTVLSMVSCAGLGDSGTAIQPQAAPQRGQEAGETFVCPAGEGATVYEAFVGEDQPGGPSTAVDAVSELLTRSGRPSHDAEFELAASNGAASQIVVERQGARVFSAYVEKIGDSWYVTEFFACPDWMESGTPTDEEAK